MTPSQLQTLLDLAELLMGMGLMFFAVAIFYLPLGLTLLVIGLLLFYMGGHVDELKEVSNK